MSEKIKKYLKNSIDEKGNYCYSLPVETTKAVIKELERLNNIINELEKSIKDEYDYCDKRLDPAFGVGMGVAKKLLDKLKELKDSD